MPLWLQWVGPVAMATAAAVASSAVLQLVASGIGPDQFVTALSTAGSEVSEDKEHQCVCYLCVHVCVCVCMCVCVHVCVCMCVE